MSEWSRFARGASTAVLCVAAVLLSGAGPSAARQSIPGDADCSGFLTEADLGRLEAELFDGDGDRAADVGEGSVDSCLGADVNTDGRVSAADLSAFVAFLDGRGTAAVAPGPVVTYIGIASAGGAPVNPLRSGRVPVYQSAGGQGFTVVIEAAPGPSTFLPTQRPGGPDLGGALGVPWLQVTFDRDLGDGSRGVCDPPGGVPGISPASFGPDLSVTNALNDIACRFSTSSNPARACTLDEFEVPGFVSPLTRVQYCLPVSSFEKFEDGGTVLTTRVFDERGNPGVAAQAVIHIGREPPPTPTPSSTRTLRSSPTPTRSTTPTRTPSGTATHTQTASVTPTSSSTPSATTRPSRSATPSRTTGGTATLTPTRSRTPSRTATLTATLTPTPSRTPTRTATGSRTPTASRTPTGSRTPASPTSTLTATRSGTATQTPTTTRTRVLSATPSRSPSRTATRSSTPSRTVTPTPTPSPSRTRTVTRTPTPSGTPTWTTTPTRTFPPTATLTLTPTRTITRTPTETRTPSPTRRPGADVSFVGIATAGGFVIDPEGTTDDEQHWPIYVWPLSYNMKVVIEGKPGPSGRRVGTNAYNWNATDPAVRPDLQVIVSRPLGEEGSSEDGSPEVCDNALPDVGGVPASSSFDETQPISNAINDFACRFVNGLGLPEGRPPSDPCTQFRVGGERFVNGASKVQFCAPIAREYGFKQGDTLVTVRLRDETGATGPAASFVVRVRP